MTYSPLLTFLQGRVSLRQSAPAGKLAWKLTGRVGARRLGRCRHNDFALGAGFAVDNRDRHGTRRFCRSRWRQGCCCRGRGGLGRGGGLRHRDDLRRFFGDPQIGRHYRHRLTARAVLGGHRPQHKRTEEQAKRHRDDLRRRNLYRLPISSRTLSKRRRQVIHRHARFRSGFVQIRDPAQCAIRESRQRAYHGLSAAGRSASRGLPQTTKNRGGT